MSQTVFKIHGRSMRRADQLYREITAAGDPFLTLTNGGQVVSPGEVGNRLDVVNSEGYINFLNTFRSQFPEFGPVDSVRRAKCIYKSLGESEKREFREKWTETSNNNYMPPADENFEQTYTNFPQGIFLAFKYHLGDNNYQRNAGGTWNRRLARGIITKDNRNWNYDNKAGQQNFYKNYAAQEYFENPVEMNFNLNWNAANSGNEAQDMDVEMEEQEPDREDLPQFQALDMQDDVGSTGSHQHGGQRKRVLGKKRAKKQRPVEKEQNDFKATEDFAEVPSAPNTYLNATQLQDLGFQNFFKIYVAHHPFEPDDLAVQKATSKYAALSPSKKAKYMKYGENPSIFFEALEAENQEPEENENYQDLPQFQDFAQPDKAGPAGYQQHGGQHKRVHGKQRAKKQRHNENVAEVSSTPNPFLIATQLEDLGFQNYFKIYVAHHPFEPDYEAVQKATAKYAALSSSKKAKYIKYGENPSIFFETTDEEGHEIKAGESVDFRE